MATTLPVNFEAPIAVNPTDDLGNAATVENMTAVCNSAAAQVFIEGGIPIVVPGNVAGETVQITVEADARIGDGERKLMGVLEFALVAAEAVNLGLSAGEIRPKTVHA